MDSRNIINIGCAMGIGGLAYVLMSKTQKNKEEKRYQKVKKSLAKNNSDLPLEEAGDPGKDELDNADMVSEGSQFGVHYYNQVKQ